LVKAPHFEFIKKLRTNRPLKKFLRDKHHVRLMKLAMIFVFVGLFSFCSLIGHKVHVYQTNQYGVFFSADSAKDVARFFKNMDYDLTKIYEGRASVPRLFLKDIPDDFNRIRDPQKKKELFIKIMLPSVIKVNEELKKERAKFVALRAKMEKGVILDTKDKAFFEKICDKYKVSTTIDGAEGNKIVLRKLDDKIGEISVSMAIAQSINESAWGTSRFARHGNALFGEWTWDGTGIVPKGRPEGETYSVKSFKNIRDSIRSYARNLNSHDAYETVRQKRKIAIKHEKPLNGYNFAGGMVNYSARGMAYVTELRSIIKQNELQIFDSSTLDKQNPEMFIKNN